MTRNSSPLAVEEEQPTSANQERPAAALGPTTACWRVSPEMRSEAYIANFELSTYFRGVVVLDHYKRLLARLALSCAAITSVLVWSLDFA